VEEVVKRLSRGRSLDKLGLGEVNGRVDLRGFPWPSSGGVETKRAGRHTVGTAHDFPELRGAHLAGIDFTGGVLPHLRLHRSTVTDCLFNDALMGDLRAWDTTFEGCELSDTDLRGSVVGSWHEAKGNVWRRCRFERTKMDKIVARGALFEDCAFIDPGLREVTLDCCSFRGVRFSGPLIDVAFHGHIKPDGPSRVVLEELDLSEAELQGVTFIGCRLSRVRFPYGGDFAVLPRGRERLERVLAGLEGDTSLEGTFLRVAVLATVRHYDPESDLYVNYDDLARDCGPRCADMMRRLVT
jgi:uncharacterized protein YjbI with pentapeptide repeats